MNVQALTRSQEIRVFTAQGYATGRLDALHGACGASGMTEVALGFGCFVHDVERNRSIHDAWRVYATALFVLESESAGVGA